MPYEGERFSLVFFCGPDIGKVSPLVKHEMFEEGFDFDWGEAVVADAAAKVCAFYRGVQTGSVAAGDGRLQVQDLWRPGC